MANEVEIILKVTDKASSVIKGTTGATGGLGAAFKSLTGFSLGGAVAIGAVVKGLDFAIKSASQAQQVMKQTEAVIKSTGGAAGLNAEQIARMSLEHSRLTGIEDEVIQSGNNMLLTFTAIGKDVFPRASRAIQDMAVAMNGGNLEGIDLKGTAIQVGKALNVVEGDTAGATRAMSALQRVGVRFTDEQKKMGAELIKNGKVMEFQSLILNELETEFGGSAKAAGETFAGEVSKLKNELGNLGEVVGGELIPSLTDMTSWVTTNLISYQGLREALDESEQSLFQQNLTMALSIIGIQDMDAVTNELDQSQRVVGETFRNSKDDLAGLTAGVDDYTEATEAATLSLSKMNQEALAQEGIKQLDTALKEGIITQGEYEIAWQQVQRSLGNASAEQIAFSIALRALSAQLQSGEISATQYKNALSALARTYNIDVVTTYKQIGTPSINPGGSFKGGKQHGGPVMGGQAYLVGEAGPELFIPGQGGQIIPNNQVNNYFNLTMNTNSTNERVVQDFNMMRAMASI